MSTTLDVACPYCGADAGSPCVTPSGSESSSMHKARVEAVDEAGADQPSAEAAAPPTSFASAEAKAAYLRGD